MMPIRKIVYPTDFSPCAELALDPAIFLAREFDADLYFLHALVLQRLGGEEDEGTFPGADELIRHLYEVSSSELATRSEQAGRELRVRQELRRAIAAAPAILEYADEIAADLIVMGAAGRRGPARWFLGSTAEEVVRRARCPVLTVPEHTAGQSLSNLETILVPVDFSAHSAGAVAAAKELAHRFHAGLLLLHVVEVKTLPNFYGPGVLVDVTPRLEQHSRAELETLAQEAEGPAGVPCQTEVVVGIAATEIVRVAAERHAGLVVLPSLGHTGLDRLLLGSTAERVVRLAECPVLTLKPRA